MKANWASMVALGVGWGCGASNVSSGDGPEAQRRLQQTMSQHAALSSQLAGAPPDHLAGCKISAGDCLLQVAESRGNLERSFRLNACDHFPDSERKTRCVTAQLDSRAHSGVLTEYYELENWCLSKLTACTSARAEEARLAALEDRFTQRAQLLEASPDGVSARNAIELVRAKVEYLRSTLPPNASAICEADVDACNARVDAERKGLHEQLRLDDHDANRAAAAFRALKETEASCGAPELDCLSSAMASFGVFPESRKWVERNLSLLAQRQELVGLASEKLQNECLAMPQRAHQPNIVAAYVVYAREPVLYFRMQLDKAFLALHQSQVSCLTSKLGPRVGHPVAATN